MPPIFFYPERSERSSFAPKDTGYNSLRGSASARRARPLPWMWLFVVLNLLKRITKAQSSVETPKKLVANIWWIKKNPSPTWMSGWKLENG